MTPEDQRDRIVLCLDNAIDEASSLADGDVGDLRDLVEHARQMHALLLSTLRAHPQFSTPEMRAYVTATGAAILQLQRVAVGPSGTTH